MTGRFFAALAVTRIISVEKLSEHLTPLYLDQAINVFHTDVDAEDGNELNGYEHVTVQPEAELDSDALVYQTQVEYLKSQALAAKELQDICLAINELIGWRLVEDIASAQSYVSTIPSSGQLLIASIDTIKKWSA